MSLVIHLRVDVSFFHSDMSRLAIAGGTKCPRTRGGEYFLHV